ncbi:tRNA pseudouridine(38-40) synthase TruA [Caproiciproducens galactitolivorans]|uniref:tRNA pseudouridine synthase A n=1 Tax=Caproiciproducens galactitolivorans TaxID=642589 RepID=A0A4Z0YAS9_9FIRM|nr:tRNA pseudouridine(38-40) synthase TruA [Caproiciproducens galactitolivorans]QEY34837.1 tRNA pseudouridine(38-40) synthase TruA [Caproiciproducens galactitolivorans]TGJ75913.1 tRNA pseudouridine synthase A [Caproiciproducens galactitolivorans]
MRNLLLTICYDGSGYHGWQIQQNAVSVQQVFQEALVRVLHEKPDIKGCSRTDSFVHAREYCVSLKTEHTIPCARLLGALNHFLPEDIAVLDCREVSPDFHARYSCIGKEYVYQIWNNPVRNPFLNHRALHYWYALDLDKLNKAAAHFLGAHDFSSFCTMDARERGNFVRTITKAECAREGDMVTFTVAADGFLYNMVRIMVGTLLRVAQGKLQPEDIPRIIEAKDRKAAGPTAPPCGLYLNHVYYEDVK